MLLAQSKMLFLIDVCSRVKLAVIIDKIQTKRCYMLGSAAALI